jgi:hypothetical protein
MNVTTIGSESSNLPESRTFVSFNATLTSKLIDSVLKPVRPKADEAVGSEDPSNGSE